MFVWYKLVSNRIMSAPKSDSESQSDDDSLMTSGNDDAVYLKLSAFRTCVANDVILKKMI